VAVVKTVDKTMNTVYYRGRVIRIFFECEQCHEEVGFLHRYCPWCGSRIQEEYNRSRELVIK
jgi:predicted amidophosphoribosyltransferase